MCKQKMLRTFSLHMVPKGGAPFETPTATPARSAPTGHFDVPIGVLQNGSRDGETAARLRSRTITSQASDSGRVGNFPLPHQALFGHEQPFNSL
jgi:hypothetical protein